MVLIEFFFELSRFNFERCERMLEKPDVTPQSQNPGSGQYLGSRKQPISPSGAASRISFTKNYNQQKDEINPTKIIETHITQGLKSFYTVFGEVGLYSPVTAGIHKQLNQKIDDQFKKFINCLKSLIEFEKFYISFGQLIPEWRLSTITTDFKGFNFKKARSDIQNFLIELTEHPFYRHYQINGVDPPVIKTGLQMLDHIKLIMNELHFYLKIKIKCLLDYLNLWKSTDSKDNYFNDYLLIGKLEDNLLQLRSELPANDLQKPQDVSLNRPPKPERAPVDASDLFNLQRDIHLKHGKMPY